MSVLNVIETDNVEVLQLMNNSTVDHVSRNVSTSSSTVPHTDTGKITSPCCVLRLKLFDWGLTALSAQIGYIV